MLVEKIARSGSWSWSVSEVIDGHLVTRNYYGYTKKEAVLQFKRDTKKEKE